MKQKKEKLIIDMRQATQHEIASLSRLLLSINATLSNHGLKIQIKKTKAAPVAPAFSLS
jgi:hypothetical protein